MVNVAPAADDREWQGETLDLIHDQVSGRLERQSDSLKQIDTKAALLLGFAAAAVQFVAARPALGWLHALSIVLYLLALAAGISAFRVRAFDDPPDPQVMIEDCKGLSRDQALTKLIGIKADALKKNRQRQEDKVKAWRASLALLAAGVVLAVLAEAVG